MVCPMTEADNRLDGSLDTDAIRPPARVARAWGTAGSGAGAIAKQTAEREDVVGEDKLQHWRGKAVA
jgi:hypothetical protein